MHSVVGFTNGCFDLLHEGHKALLREAQLLCRHLVVAINDDASVSALKGHTRPIQPLPVRLAAVKQFLRWGTRDDDYVLPFNSEDQLRDLIRRRRPEIIFKGADYEGKPVVGSDLARVVLIPRLEGYSTTSEIAKRRA